MDTRRPSRARSAPAAIFPLLAATLALSVIGGCGTSSSGSAPEGGADGGALVCGDLAAMCAARGRCVTPLATAIAETCAGECGPFDTQPCHIAPGLTAGPTQTFIDWILGDAYLRYAYDADGNLVGVVSNSTMTTPAWSCGGVPGFDPTEAMTVPEPAGADEAVALLARCPSAVDAGTD